MTREEIMVAVNNAFDVEVWASVGSWSITIETAPKRQLIFGDELVKQLLSGAIDPEEFDGMLRNLRRADWTSSNDGSLAYVLR